MKSGIAFSIMGLLPSIASTLSYSLPAGPAGLVWVRGNLGDHLAKALTTRQGWFVASGFIFVVGLAMADLGRPNETYNPRISTDHTRKCNAYVRRPLLLESVSYKPLRIAI
jgi:hypothetical protein